ncbi:MAG: hypothetical protein ABFD82_03825 [Syntrophaceae bacterium]
MIKPRTLLGKWLQLSDPHCGHLVGLTHPEKWSGPDTKWGRTQRQCWNFFTESVDKHKPFDVVHINGDLTAGKNKKQGARQLLTADMKEQAQIAVEAIRQAECKKIRICRGTPYHVGSDDAWEDVAVLQLKEAGISDVGICNHGFYRFCGKNVDVKHKLASSGIPHGRTGPLAKEILWNRIWHLHKGQALSDLTIRSHVHYFQMIRDDGCIGVSTPSLQGLGDDHAEQAYSGTVDFGIVVFYFWDDGSIEVVPEIMKGVISAGSVEEL